MILEFTPDRSYKIDLCGTENPLKYVTFDGDYVFRDAKGQLHKFSKGALECLEVVENK